MVTQDTNIDLYQRFSPIEMSPEEFRALGHELVDRIAELFGSLPDRPVTPGESPAQIRQALGGGPAPALGLPPEILMDEATRLLFDHSLFNGHPRFWGYITSSAAPIGVLADMLAAAVNPNVGGAILSPMATEIEVQTVRWIAEMIGYPEECGGLLVSGGNMANFVCFVAARRASAGWDVRKEGMAGGKQLVAYTSMETHTWIQKAADLFGLGTDAIRWVKTGSDLRMDLEALRRHIEQDREAGLIPFLVTGTAGSVSTGAIDPLPELAELCREQNLWFHVDGAYGGFAAALSDAPADLKGLSEADSVAVDPHKWLYAPLEAGCALVRDSVALRDAFSYRPAYYHLGQEEDLSPNFYEYGPQNSRGFRALKVWLALRQVGLDGYRRMISDDIRLAEELYRLASEDPELEAHTQGLSITTFRYVPGDLQPGSEEVEEYLNKLNKTLLDRLEAGGECFVSNAIVGGKFLLRACIVNFRTTLADIEVLPQVVVRLGREVDKEMRA